MIQHIFAVAIKELQSNSFIVTISIGKFLGATVVVTVNISGTGAQKRMVIKAIDVLTGEIVSMATVGL